MSHGRMPVSSHAPWRSPHAGRAPSPAIPAIRASERACVRACVRGELRMQAVRLRARGHACRHVYRHACRHVYIDMYIDMCTGMWIDVCWSCSPMRAGVQSWHCLMPAGFLAVWPPFFFYNRLSMSVCLTVYGI